MMVSEKTVDERM